MSVFEGLFLVPGGLLSEENDCENTTLGTVSECLYQSLLLPANQVQSTQKKEKSIVISFML